MNQRKTDNLHTLFEKQAELHPNAIALTFNETNITYQQLNAQANQLAHYLNSIGVKPGDKVKICIERSIEMIIGILGILKSGAAYIPLDPTYPAERFKFLLNDTDSPIILTRSHLAEKFLDTQTNILCLDKSWDEISRYSAETSDIDVIDENIAIILYTSGTTGTPKGVLLSHKSIVNRIVWDNKTYQHTENNIVLQHSAFTFDFSILEIFMALSNGGRLVLARPELHYESTYLIQLIQKERITHICSVPSLFKLYFNKPGFKECKSLKQVFLGGEVLEFSVQKDFFEHCSAELINVYGPTEATISALHWTCQKNDGHIIIPIGYPVADLRIYILDENMKKVATGQEGEIFISGVGVANGYHNRPELTKERFLQDPFSQENGNRMYKTGDFGKELSNGAIQFLGRKDFQVKLRGVRIELQEIEYHINLQKNILSSVVVGVPTKDGKMNLVAYILPVKGADINYNEIQENLSSKLSHHMIPSMFILIKEIPLSPNGKVDRSALPKPDNVRLLSGNSYIPATNDIEAKLVQFWETILKLSPIGITDSFYRLGGDSLAASEIHYLMETEIKNSLPLSSFANAETIQKQAQIINSKNTIDLDKKFAILRAEGTESPILYLKQAIGGKDLSFLKQFVDSINYDHPFIYLFPSSLDITTGLDSIEQYAEYYVQLLEEFPQKEYIVGGYSMGGLIAYEIATLLSAKGHLPRLVFLIDTFHPNILRNQKNGVYTIWNKLSVDIEKLIRNDWKSKIRAVHRIFKIGMDLIIKIVKGNSVQKPEKEERQNIIKGINISFALSYEPKPYKGKTLLISAGDEHFSGLSELAWQNIIETLKVEKIGCDHNTIMEEYYMNIVTHFLNKHLENS